MSGEEGLVYVDRDLEPLIPRFVERRSEDLRKLRQALADGDLVTIGDIGHALKGSCGSYGFSRLSEIGAAIETAALARDAPRATSEVAALARHLEVLDVRYR